VAFGLELKRLVPSKVGASSTIERTYGSAYYSCMDDAANAPPPPPYGYYGAPYPYYPYSYPYPYYGYPPYYGGPAIGLSFGFGGWRGRR